ncbi:MAG TPA: hypothetical protein VG317_18270 [Pseudonocardiaceae bacterium]|jgi:hypothetical protein|nr:hypothetical protein [Pseudonocardiaceae bacterium]
MTGETNSGDGRYTLPTPDLSVFGDAPAEGAGPAEGGTSAEGADPAGGAAPDEPWAHPHGGVRFQDAATTRARPPSLAEQRARQQAEEAEEEAREQQFVAAGRSRGRRRLVLIAGVVVAIALVAGLLYLLNPPTVTANCVAADGSSADTVANDQYCDASYVTSHGGYVQNGLIFWPIGNGLYQHYRYYYGGSVTGGRVTGGSFTAPSRATIKTRSGSTIQRGGFGVGGSSGGGSGSKSGKTGRSGGRR